MYHDNWSTIAFGPQTADTGTFAATTGQLTLTHDDWAIELGEFVGDVRIAMLLGTGGATVRLFWEEYVNGTWVEKEDGVIYGYGDDSSNEIALPLLSQVTARAIRRTKASSPLRIRVAYTGTTGSNSITFSVSGYGRTRLLTSENMGDPNAMRDAGPAFTQPVEP